MNNKSADLYLEQGIDFTIGKKSSSKSLIRI